MALPGITVAATAPVVNEKVGTATVSVTLSFAVWLPPVPVTVKVYVPAATVVAAVNFKVAVPEPGDAIVAGVNAAVTPVGAPVTVKATADFRVSAALEVIVVWIDWPAGNVSAEEAAVRERAATVELPPQLFTNWLASTEPKPVA